MPGREIVTLQLGHYANFTGAHWWNIQEASFVYDPKVLQAFPKEISHDVLFREGLTLKGEVTFTPRLVALDLKGSLNSLRKDGVLYTGDKEEEDVKWSGDVTLHKSDSVQKNQFLQDLDTADSDHGVDSINEDRGGAERGRAKEKAEHGSAAQPQREQVVFGQPFYDLDDQVRVWSDFMAVHLHPRSVQITHDFMLDNDDQPFDVFGMGCQALSGQAWDDWEDRVRFFTEECDCMQGFQVLFDGHNGFGGAASKVLSHLTDDFPGKAVMTVPISPAVLPDQTARQRATRILNSALCVGQCADKSALYLPLSLASSLWRNMGAPRSMPHLTYSGELMYHTSAVLAASVDTMTLPYRQDTSSFSLTDITALACMGRKVASLNTSLPFPMHEGETLVDCLMCKRERPLWTCLTPGLGGGHDPPASHTTTAQVCVARGLPTDRLNRAGCSPRGLSSCTSVQDIVQLYLTETFPSTMNAGFVLRDGVKVTSPFPNIFQPSVSKTGFLSHTHRPTFSGVESAPMLTLLQCGSGAGGHVDSLHREAARFNIHKHHHFLQAGLEEQEFHDTLDTLRSLADCYGPPDL